MTTNDRAYGSAAHPGLNLPEHRMVRAIDRAQVKARTHRVGLGVLKELAIWLDAAPHECDPFALAARLRTHLREAGRHLAELDEAIETWRRGGRVEPPRIDLRREGNGHG